MKYALLATLMAFTAAPAFAANPVYTDGQTTMNVNAGGSCKTPREQYEQFVRVRPLALVNEGAQPAFVNCWFPVLKEAATQFGGVERFSLMLSNQNIYGTAPKKIDCTAVVGKDSDGANVLRITKTVTLAAGARGLIQWDAPTNAGWMGNVSAWCFLPSNTAINETSVHWDYNDAT